RVRRRSNRLPAPNDRPTATYQGATAMTLATLAGDIRKTATDPTPVYAAVGVTDLAIERVRKAGVRAASVRVSLDVSALQDKAVKRAEKVAEQAQQIPALAVSQTAEIAGKARETYTELAVRGEKLVK